MDRESAATPAVLVTGGGKRLGRAIVEGLAADGWHVVIHHNASAADSAAVAERLRGAGHRAATLQADLAEARAVEAMIPTAAAMAPGLCAVVNNASLFEPDHADTFSVDRWDAHHAINLRAPAILARDLARHVAATTAVLGREPGPGSPPAPPAPVGCIVNLLDQKVFNLNPDFFSYTIAKQALEGMTRTLAMALAPRLRVNGVAPGLTLPSKHEPDATFERAHRTALLGESSRPDDIVDAVRYLLSARAVTGQTLIVDGGQHLQPLDRDILSAV